MAQSNAELARIFEEDQKDRADWQHQTSAGQQSVARRDDARRSRVSALLKSGALRTGQDYERAAFIFQHGSAPSDYLLAHVLAMTGEAIDPGCCTWIGAATLDRYLQSTGQPQIFGTQLTDQEPFQRDFLPDGVRAANCVPSLAGRERMMRALEDKKPLPPIAPCAPQLERLNGSWSMTERLPGGGFAHSVIAWRGGEGEITLQEGDLTSTADRFTIAGRELRFHVRDRDYIMKLEGNVMHGVVSRPNGDQRPVVALHDR